MNCRHCVHFAPDNPDDPSPPFCAPCLLELPPWLAHFLEMDAYVNRSVRFDDSCSFFEKAQS